MKPQNEQQEISSALKDLRERLGLSQQQFATRLNTSVTSISRWERGVKSISMTVPQMQALVRELKAINWDVEDFLKRVNRFETKTGNAANIPSPSSTPTDEG